MIEVHNLSKRYGNKIALNDVSFTVNEGDILGFLGPNGAGKTTTMNILTGYISSNEGNVKINGHDVLDNPKQAKENIGYLPEHPPLYKDMTVKAYLGFLYELKKCKLPKTKHLQEVTELIKIDHVYNRVIGHLSKGYQQRVGLAGALIGDPKILILDEPTVGLDPQQIIEIRKLIRQLGQTHTIILSSHILHEVQAVCERIIIVNEGEIAADDTPANLAKSLAAENSCTVKIKGVEDDIYHALKSIPHVEKAISSGEVEKGIFEFTVEPKDSKDIRYDIWESMKRKDYPILGLKDSVMSLEDVFLRLTNAKEEIEEQIYDNNETNEVPGKRDSSVKLEDYFEVQIENTDDNNDNDNETKNTDDNNDNDNSENDE